MNYPTLYGQQVQPRTCGRCAVQNDELAFWQSRETRERRAAPLPQLTDIPMLAHQVRVAFAAEGAQ